MNGERKMVRWICHDCGVKYCNRIPTPYGTYHVGICECCGTENVPCSEPRDYGQLKTGWEKVLFNSKNHES